MEQINNVIKFPNRLKALFNIPKEKRIIVIDGGRASGKTWSAALFLLLKAGLSKCRIVCARETASAIDRSSKALMEDLITSYNMPGFAITDKEITHKNGSNILFLGLKGSSNADTKVRVKGLEGCDYFFCDEAESLSTFMISLIDPTIRKNDSKLIFVLNPYADPDPIFEFYPRDRTDVLNITINYFDNPFCPEVIKAEAQRLKEYDFEAWSHIYNGQPIGQSERAIFSRKQVMDAMKRTECDDKVEQEVISCDVARFGDDKTVAYKRRGYRVIDSRTWSQQDTFTTAECLLNWAGENTSKIIIDDTGIGGGVSDAINRLKHKYNRPNINVVAINFASSPKDKTKYNSIISEMWLEFPIDKIILPEDKQLHLELTARQYTFEKTTSRRVVESKADFKKRGFNSPDRADAMLLCFYEPNNFAKKIRYRI